MGTWHPFVQVTNIAPSTSRDQLKTLFGHIGSIDEFVIYPAEDPGECMSKVCYIRYHDVENAGIALHLNNTVFLDRPLIVLPLPIDQPERVPTEDFANVVRAPDYTTAGVLPRSADWPVDVISMVVGRPGEQVILTLEPRLAASGLPSYPPLPATTDGNKIEEIRRTILVTNLDPATTGEEVLEFFGNFAEVRCVRMAGSEAERGVYVEFTLQTSIVKSFELMGATLNNKQIMIQHATTAIAKPASYLGVSLDEAAKRVKEAELLITGSVKKMMPDRSRSRSRHGRRSRSRSRDRRGRRSQSKGSRRSRRNSRSRHRRSSRSPSKKRRSRSRDNRDKKKERSRSRDRKTSRRRSGSRSKRRSRSRKRSGSRSRRKSGSRSRRKSGSRSRRKSGSRSRRKSGSRTRRRSGSRTRRRSGSRSRRKSGSRTRRKSRSRSRGRRDRGKDRERGHRDRRDRDRKRDSERDRKRGRSKDKEREKDTKSRSRQRSGERDAKRKNDRKSQSKEKDGEEKKEAAEMDVSSQMDESTLMETSRRDSDSGSQSRTEDRDEDSRLSFKEEGDIERGECEQGKVDDMEETSQMRTEDRDDDSRMSAKEEVVDTDRGENEETDNDVKEKSVEMDESSQMETRGEDSVDIKVETPEKEAAEGMEISEDGVKDAAEPNHVIEAVEEPNVGVEDAEEAKVGGVEDVEERKGEDIAMDESNSNVESRENVVEDTIESRCEVEIPVETVDEHASNADIVVDSSCEVEKTQPPVEDLVKSGEETVLEEVKTQQETTPELPNNDSGPQIPSSMEPASNGSTEHNTINANTGDGEEFQPETRDVANHESEPSLPSMETSGAKSKRRSSPKKAPPEPEAQVDENGEDDEPPQIVSRLRRSTRLRRS